MEYKIGYISAWRRMVFFVTVFCMIILGICMSVAGSVFGTGMISAAICIAAILICIVLMIIVFSDKFSLFEGMSQVEFNERGFHYRDKKKSLDILYGEIKKIDIQPIKFGEGVKYIIAFRILIETEKKKYYIESERSSGRTYEEVDIYNLYLELQKRRG